MNRPRYRALLLVALAVAASACGSNDSASTSVAAPTPILVSEPSFTGTLSLNGAITHPFLVTRFGQIVVQLAALDPDPDATGRIGVALGTWNGDSCALVITRDSMAAGTVLIGTATSAGTFCVRTYDAAGTLTEPVTFNILITHY